jgi:two-component system sensor histidine kinase ChiS
MTPRWLFMCFSTRVPALILTLVILLLCLARQTKGQPRIKFQKYALEEGLSQSYVFCMLQDSRGFLWFGTEDGLNRFDGVRFKTYRHDPDDPASLSHNNVRSLYEDEEGTLWIGTYYGGLNRFDRMTESFYRMEHDPGNPSSLSDNDVRVITADQQGVLWLGTLGGGLNYLHPGHSGFGQYRHLPEDASSLSSDQVLSLAVDHEGRIWVGTIDGLNRLDPDAGTFRRYKNDPADETSLANNRVNALHIDWQGALWIGTHQGLDRYDPAGDGFVHYPLAPDSGAPVPYQVISIQEGRKNELWIGTYRGALLLNTRSGTINAFKNNPLDPKSLSDNTVNSLEVDSEGGVWIGTRDGVHRFDRKLHRFRHYEPEPGNPRSLPHKSIWGFHEDREGILWVETRAGTVPFDLDAGVIPDGGISPAGMRAAINEHGGYLLEDRRDRTWISGGKGLFSFDRDRNRVVRHFPTPSGPEELSDSWAYWLYECRDGTLWMRTRIGIARYNLEQRKFVHHRFNTSHPDSLGSNSVTHFLEDRQGNLWLGRRGGGLSRLDREANRFVHFTHNPNDPASISDDVVHAILEDSEGRIWVSTASGLNLLLDKKTGRFRRFFEKHGLPNDFVYGVLEDDRGHLWMGTNRGIARLDTQSMTFRTYDPSDGQQINEFNDDSYYRNPRTGEMFFGGVNGFTVFHPDSIRADTFRPPVVISRLQYLGQGEEGAILTEVKGISEKMALTLTHRQKRLLVIEFAGLSFSKPGKNQYLYQLAGDNEEWIPLGERREVSFADLEPGRYTLRVKGSNGDGFLNNETPAELHLTILPPWWWTRWAKGLYLLGFFGALFGIRRYEIRRRLDRERAAHLQQLDAFKTRFFTNITHEFRTPLTVVIGEAGQLLQKYAQLGKNGVQDKARSIRRNGRQLLRLVNQMLDLVRIEAGKLEVNRTENDLIAFLKYCTEAFHSLADAKKINLRFHSEQDQLVTVFDQDKVQQIFSNLVSNAVKYTPEGGDVYISVKEATSAERTRSALRTLSIEVKDTGIGISAEDLPFIFDRFRTAPPSPPKGGGDHAGGRSNRNDTADPTPFGGGWEGTGVAGQIFRRCRPRGIRIRTDDAKLHSAGKKQYR